MSTDLINLISESSIEVNEDSKVLLDESTDEYCRYRSTRSDRDGRRVIDKRWNSTLLNFGKCSQVLEIRELVKKCGREVTHGCYASDDIGKQLETVANLQLCHYVTVEPSTDVLSNPTDEEFDMDWKCNFSKEFISPESSTSALHDNWNKEEQLPRINFERGDVEPGETFSFEGWDVMEDEKEIHLPRQFLPQGLDWDYQFEETDYGRDVVVVSESEHSTDTMAGGFSSISHKLANAKVIHANITSSSDSSLNIGRRVRPKSVSQQNRSSSLKIKDKKGGDKRKTVIVEPNLKQIGSFLAVMDDIRDRAKSMTERQVQLLNAQRVMNNEVRKQAKPRCSGGSWDVDDEQANELMRRGTLEHFNFSISRKSTIQGEKLQELKRVTRELATLDLRRDIVLTDADMKEFCYANYNNTRDLVLQGREVFNKTGRRVQDFDLPYIFTFLVTNPDVVYLDLSYNQITNTGAWYIMDFLSWNASLLGLNLMNNDIDALDSHMIDALCENTTLKSLRMNGNPLGKKGGEYIAFLLMFKELEHLDLGQTDQTVESLAWISQALMQYVTLKVLDLSRVLGYQGYVSDSLHFALTFSDILRFCVSLAELHLGKNGLTDVDLEQIMFGLSFNKRLELLDLACNRIGDLGAEMIAGALHWGAPLKALVLNTNRIGNLGARAMSLNLPMSQIKFLDVAKNRIEDQGIIDIVHTIRKPYPLLALFIFGNKFAAPALEAIQNIILSNDLNPESLDIKIFNWEGALGHGHNSAADRYRPRYYRVPVNNKTERSGQRVNAHKPCRPGCLDYKFHNVVNVCGFQQRVASNNLGPSCPV